jgi:hypothetical protein
MTSRNEVDQPMLKATHVDHDQQPRQQIDLQAYEEFPPFSLHDQTSQSMTDMMDMTRSIKPDYLQSYLRKFCDATTPSSSSSELP